jgi:hypothetical protein
MIVRLVTLPSISDGEFKRRCIRSLALCDEELDRWRASAMLWLGLGKIEVIVKKSADSLRNEYQK